MQHLQGACEAGSRREAQGSQQAQSEDERTPIVTIEITETNTETKAMWNKIEALLQSLSDDVPTPFREAWLWRARASLCDLFGNIDDAEDPLEQRARDAARQHHKQGDDGCVVCEVSLVSEVPLCEDCAVGEEADEARDAYDDETRKLEEAADRARDNA
jgi:hypothetical protein